MTKIVIALLTSKGSYPKYHMKTWKYVRISMAFSDNLILWTHVKTSYSTFRTFFSVLKRKLVRTYPQCKPGEIDILCYFLLEAHITVTYLEWHLLV